jgi:hypothetical protein
LQTTTVLRVAALLFLRRTRVVMNGAYVYVCIIDVKGLTANWSARILPALHLPCNDQRPLADFPRLAGVFYCPQRRRICLSPASSPAKSSASCAQPGHSNVP